MISLRKLQRMPLDTALRHAARRIEALEQHLPLDEPMRLYLLDMLQWLHQVQPRLIDAQRVARCRELLDEDRTEDPSLRFELNSLRHILLGYLGMEPAEWDFSVYPGAEGSRAGSAGASPLAAVSLYLDDIRSPFNLGSVIRTAAALGVGELLLSPDSVDPEHPRAVRSAMGCILPIRRMSREELQQQKRRLVALETGGVSIHSYQPVQEGFVLLLGSEELGLHPDLLSAAHDRVSLPLYGPKASLNVGVAAGAALCILAARLFAA